MTIPILTDIAQARATVLRRVPPDELLVSERVLDGIEARFGERLTPSDAVARIIHDVRTRGDAALREWTERLDGVVLEHLEVPRERLAAACDSLESDIVDALHILAAELERFHQHQARNTWVDFSVEGALGQLVVPLERVGLYVPGGTAPLPSSLLHAAIPARVAGVKDLVVCTPPQHGRQEPAPIVLAAAHVAGIERVFLLGGAQAIAAMAYGTESIPRVDKIVGPGNLFVLLAKRAVYGAVGIESLPGPTETLVIADEHANPVFVAADALAQAEHVLASAIIITTSESLAHAVRDEIARQIELLPTENADAARETIEERGAIIVVTSIDDAIDLANEYAPEHLCLLVTDPWYYVSRVRHAGGIFLGEDSFEVLGDYVAGPSHIMPTGSTARYTSPVNVDDFRKIISLVGLNRTGLRRVGPASMVLAEAEGLFAHANAVRVRLQSEY